jgi:uncharacterized protein YggE
MKNVLTLSAYAAAILTLTACNPATTYVSTGASTAPQISVSATGEVAIAPDRAMVSAGVVTQGPDAGAAMAQNARLMNAVFEQLEKAGLPRKNIHTSQLSLQPRYDYQNRKAPRITGYEARNTVTAKTENLDQVGPMLDALVAAGVNNINNVRFSVKDPKAARDKAREQAIIEARAKAASMAAAAGVSLGELQSLSEASGGRAPQPVYAMAREMSADMSTPVAPGEQTLSVTVNMTYAIKQ